MKSVAAGDWILRLKREGLSLYRDGKEIVASTNALICR